MLAATLALAVGRVNLDVVAVGGDVIHRAAVIQGAEPGHHTFAYVDPNAASRIGPAPLHTSAFLDANTDLLYVGESVARVALNATEGNIILGHRLLTAFSRTYGVCDGTLYLRSLPRHCKRGNTGMVACAMGTAECGVTFSATQHRGACGTDHKIGDISIAMPCTTALVIGGKTVEAVVAANTTVVSIYQANLNYEYDADVDELWLYEPPEVADGLPASAPMLLIVLFLSVWQRATRSLNAAVLANDKAAIEAVWQTLAGHAMITGDAVAFAAGSKAYGLVTEAKVFFPESADDALTADFVVAYSFWFVAAVAVLTAVLFVVLAGMLLERRPIGWLSDRTAPLRAFVHSDATSATTCVALRWAVDAVMLIALHITVPAALGDRFRSIVGFGAGVALATVAGRDTVLLAMIGQSTPAAILTVVAAAAAWLHAAFFMMLDVFSGPLAHGEAPATMAAVVAWQCVGAGAVWTLGARDKGRDPDARSPESHQHQL